MLFSQAKKINQAACDLAKGVAQEGGVYFAGSICQTASLYSCGAGKSAVMRKFKEQVEIFIQNNVDLIIAEVIVFCINSCLCSQLILTIPYPESRCPLNSIILMSVVFRFFWLQV